MYFSGIRDVGLARSVPISSTYPLFATTFAVLGLGGILTLRRALGVLLVVGLGLLLTGQGRVLAIVAGGAILVW